MSKTTVASSGIDLSDNFAFTGTVTGTDSGQSSERGKKFRSVFPVQVFGCLFLLLGYGAHGGGLG